MSIDEFGNINEEEDDYKDPMCIYNKDIGQFIRVAEKAKELNNKNVVNAINKYIYI